MVETQTPQAVIETSDHLKHFACSVAWPLGTAGARVIQCQCTHTRAMTRLSCKNTFTLTNKQTAVNGRHEIQYGW